MRKRLMAAAAIAPLSLIGLAPALAQTTISNTQSAPQSTASTGDLTVASGGTLQPTVSGAAVTINSNNAVANNGTITTKDIDNVTGILAQGGVSGAITNTGTISITEAFTPSDSANSDGIAEAPFAQGSNRYGIRLLGPFNGSITNSGTITVQGNNSVAVAVDGGLNGALLSTGTISVTGDNTIGVRTAGEITGGVQITGTLNAKGLNAVGLQTNGSIDGSLTFYSTVTATGYASTTRSTVSTALQKIQATAPDVQQGGVALQIKGSVLGGVFFGAPPINTAAGATTDLDNDGIADGVEATSNITSFGSAPALQIGATTPITIGNFGAGQNAFGLVVRGSISGNGVYDGFSATGVDIGAAGGGVNLTGGISIVGSVGAIAYQADATALHLESGAVAPTIQVFTGSTTGVGQGNLSATVASTGANTATALVIDQGATVNTLDNFGNITASVTGDKANASAVIDRSGTLNFVENTGSILATLKPTATGETVTGRGIALDLSNNTSGVTLRQELDGATAPSIIGDVLLGTGPNTVQLLSGKIEGALALGVAAGSLTIDNGASYVGALSYTGSQLAINVVNGTLQNNATGPIGASTLNVGASGNLIVALDPLNGTSTAYNVSGAAVFANGAKIGATLLSEPTAGQTFTIVRAGSLSVGSADTTLLTSLPYLFDGSVRTDLAAKTISLIINTKTTAQMGMNKAEAAAFPAIYAALTQDPSIQTAIISATTREGLISGYDQLLPASSGDVFQTALNMSKAISRATSDRFDPATQRDGDDAPSTTGLWASEFYSGIEQSKAENNPFHSAALGVIGGIDFGGSGATFAIASANVTRPHSSGDTLNSVSRLEGGLYLAPRWGGLSVDARIGGGFLKMTDRRQFITSIVSGDLSTTSTVSRTALGDWSGYDLTAHLGAGYMANVGNHFFVQPKVYADFFHTHENAYSERGGGGGYDFVVSGRDATQTSAAASAVAGMRFGSSFILSPQIEVGYESVVQGGPGNTTARFAYGGATFTVPGNAAGGAAIARFALKGDGNYIHFSLQGGGEFRSNYRAVDLRAVFRMTY
jgi:hypothetical protein